MLTLLTLLILGFIFLVCSMDKKIGTLRQQIRERDNLISDLVKSNTSLANHIRKQSARIKDAEDGPLVHLVSMN